jgi:CubicO group peptidase (beta-lactamase class C family)
MGRVLLALSLIGATWLAWDVATDDAATSTGDRFERIDEYVTDQMNDSRIPGATLAIVDHGQVVHARGFGNDGRGNQVTADTPFWLGSNTKSITALAVMQLSEAGLVELDAPAQNYLPQFRVADEAASAQITVRHLLNQTSGISRHDGLQAVLDADERDSIGDVVADMADLKLNRPVGERFEYANLNYVVLGAVIEAVTGDSWQNYVQVNIFDPLEMTNAYIDQRTAENNGLTATHRYLFGFPIETDADHYTSLAPTGYVYASSNDMARYLTMYLNGGTLDGRRLLSETGIAGMLTPATNERTFPLHSNKFTARYGAGWFIGPFGAADDARWHQGSLPHFAAWMVQLPDTEQAIIVMLNAGNQFEIGGANAAWGRIPQGVVNILRDTEPPTGTGTARFFIVLDALVALAVVAQAWTLVHVAGRRRPRTQSMLRRIAPLGWELVVAPLAFIGYPAVTGGLGWSAAFYFVPDLSMTVLAVAGLAVLTGLARVLRLVTTRHNPTAGPPLDARSDFAEPGFAPDIVEEDHNQLTRL